MVRLGVNIDHVATVREARGGPEPDPAAAAILAELAGADGIVAHLREDRRHIQERDLRLLRGLIRTKLDLEMAVTDEILKIALDIRPEVVTFVPERREERTTEGGLNLAVSHDEIANAIRLLHDGGIRVSLFLEPDLEQIKAGHKLRADLVEIHTGAYVNAQTESTAREELSRVEAAARFAAKLGLGVAAGHGLNYRNVVPIAQIPEIEELNIGHSIVSRAVLVGMERAVREMKALLNIPFK